MSRAGTPPSPEVDPGREARIALYAERAARGEDLMTGIRVITGPEPEQDPPEPTARDLRSAAKKEARRLAREEAGRRPCPDCGEEVGSPKPGGRPRSHCGGTRCARAARPAAPPVPPAQGAAKKSCPTCEKEFVSATRRYCSQPCAARSRWVGRPPSLRRAARSARAARSTCIACSREIAQGPTGRTRVYCSVACRSRSARQAAGSPLLRALAAGLRAAADALDEALGEGGA